MGAQIRMTAAEYQALYGTSVQGHTTGPKKKPQIKIPKLGWDKANKTELSARDYLQAINPEANLRYEAITLTLPSGSKYTPDIMRVIETKSGSSITFFEVKGPHIHNQRSIHAFKEARSAFPFWSWIFMQHRGGQWTFAEG